jgi:hypothetical protein
MASTVLSELSGFTSGRRSGKTPFPGCLRQLTKHNRADELSRPRPMTLLPEDSDSRVKYQE